jgi:hypothetical protein
MFMWFFKVNRHHTFATLITKKIVMKKIFLLIVMAGSFAVAKAQISYGAKAGLNVANVGGEDVEGNKAKAGFYLGGFIGVPVAESFSIQPELVFSLQGVKFDGDSKVNMSYLNIPILARYTTGSGFFAETGPQLGFLLSAKAKEDGESSNVKDYFKKTDFSWALGVGYQFESNIGVNARFNFGLSKLDEDGEVKMYNRVFQVGLFYRLGNSGK